jgi:hypothetical protein
MSLVNTVYKVIIGELTDFGLNLNVLLVYTAASEFFLYEVEKLRISISASLNM